VLGADTNILVRLIVRDDDLQCGMIEELMASERLLVSLSVILETEWVLRSSYRQSRIEIAATLTELTAVESLVFEARGDLLWALDRYAAGADMGDMIHLISNRDMRAFVTLDRKLSVQAGPDTPLPIRTLV